MAAKRKRKEQRACFSCLLATTADDPCSARAVTQSVSTTRLMDIGRGPVASYVQYGSPCFHSNSSDAAPTYFMVETDYVSICFRPAFALLNQGLFLHQHTTPITSTVLDFVSFWWLPFLGCLLKVCLDPRRQGRNIFSFALATLKNSSFF